MNPDAAWYYPKPRPEAANSKDHIAFWHGVRIETDGDTEADQGVKPAGRG